MEDQQSPLLSPLLSFDDKPLSNTPLHMPAPYRINAVKAAAYLVACVASLGVFYLVTRWVLSVRVWATLTRARSLLEAHYVLVSEDAPLVGEPGASLAPVRVGSDGVTRYYEHKGLRYVWDARHGGFRVHELPLAGAPRASVATALALGDMAHDERDALLLRYGLNEMRVPVPSVAELVADELASPFYVFQVCSVIIWLLQVYWVYASAIFVLATAGLGFGVAQTRRNNAALQLMARHYSRVTLRSGRALDASELVPGDVVQLDAEVPCDLVLLQGECVVNEASLTGESVPVVKTPLPPDAQPFDWGADARHVLFGGTQLRRARGHPLGLVVRTGYASAKGEMIRQILFPKRHVFRFYRDALVFLGVLFVITLAGFAWSVWRFVVGGASALLVALRVLDLFTIVIPPALPIAMTAGTSLAVARLRGRGVYCVVPRTVNVAGRVNVMCWDKTGTLTVDHMDVHCVRAVVAPNAAAARFSPAEHRSVQELGAAPPALVWALAACHSVVLLSATEVVGDPLEVVMMQWTRWAPSAFASEDGSGPATMTSPAGAQSLHTLARHDFSSALARMSCVVRAPDGTLWALVKGAPELLRTRCTPSSVPADYDATLAAYTAQGMRTIALAAKPVDAPDLPRDRVECDLQLLGLLVLVNPLKPTSRELMEQLSAARVRSVMVTGDNALTAINVARHCSIARPGHTCVLVEGADAARLVHAHATEPCALDWAALVARAADWDLALTGAAFDHLVADPDVDGALRATVLAHCCVFARTSPLQKAAIVGALKLDPANTVGMCGDGSNDCGALKAADAGLSISDGEAAIAAPFTAADTGAVVQLLLEGRCALATSMALFKFMIAYSVVQFVGVIICYTALNLLADLHFLWVDLFLILPLSFAMGLTGPVATLTPARPPHTLFRVSVVLSVLAPLLLMGACYAGLVATLRVQPWWDSPDTLLAGTTRSVTQLVTVVFLFGNFIYVDVALAYSIGTPFRRPVWTNWALTAVLALATLCNVLWYWVPAPALRAWWSLVDVPLDAMGAMFGLALGLALAIVLTEWALVRLLLPRDTKMHQE